MANIIIIGPAHPLRGGLATFNHRLAKEFLSMGHQCSIWSFSLQYPSLLFPGKTQYSDAPAPAGIPIRSKINSVNPFNWINVGNQLKKLKPDLIIVRYWLPFMGPALGTLLRRVKKNRHTRIVCIADNIVPHEKRLGDLVFTKYFIKTCDAFITMSDQVMKDLRRFTPKPAALVLHPLYDNFGDIIPAETARKHLGIDPSQKIILFFGFIRKYKGLDLLLRATALLRPKLKNFKILVAGEFYEDDKPYQQLISELGIKEELILKTQFIPDEEVKYYLCAADLLVQPYKNATQSGVTPLAYYFEKPMVVTNVGGLPDLVPHEQCGLVSAPEPDAIAQAVARFFEMGAGHFLPHLRKEKQKYSWPHLAQTILNIGALPTIRPAVAG